MQRRNPVRCGLFVDAQNVASWPIRIDLARLKEVAPVLGQGQGVLETAVVVAALRPGENGKSSTYSFLVAARHLGYQVVSRWASYQEEGRWKGDVDALLGFWVAREVGRLGLHRVVLVTADGDYAPLMQILRHQGIETAVVGPKGATAADLLLATDSFHYAEDLDLSRDAEGTP